VNNRSLDGFFWSIVRGVPEHALVLFSFAVRTPLKCTCQSSASANPTSAESVVGLVMVLGSLPRQEYTYLQSIQMSSARGHSHGMGGVDKQLKNSDPAKRVDDTLA